MHLNFFDVILIFRIDSNLCRPLGRAWWSAVSPLAPLGRGLRLAARRGALRLRSGRGSLVAVLSRGLLPPSPLMRARRHPLPRAKPADTSCAFHRGVVFYFPPQACLPEFTPHRASLWCGA